MNNPLGNCRSNPEVVGSIPTEVKRFFSLGAVHFYEKEGGGAWWDFFWGGRQKRPALKGAI